MSDLEALLIREVITATSDTSLTEVTALMTNRLKSGYSAAASSCVCLTAGRVLGVITQADIVALLGGQVALSSLTVGEVLSPSPRLLQIEDWSSLAEIGSQFCQQQTSVLVMVDREQHFLGLLAQEQVLQALIESISHWPQGASLGSKSSAPPCASSLAVPHRGLKAELEQSSVCDKVLEAIANPVHACLPLPATLQAAHPQETALLALLAQKALKASHLDQFLDEVVTHVAQALDLEFCGILELLPNRAALLLKAGVGWPQSWMSHATVRADPRSQYGYTLSQDHPIAVDDLRLENRFSDTPFLHNQGIVSGVSTLIPGKESPYGILSAHARYQRHFTQADVNLLQGAADILSAIIRRYQTEEALTYAAQAIQKSQEQYVTLASLVPVGIFRADAQGNSVYVNERWCQLTGVNQAAALGSGWQRAIYPADLPLVSQAWFTAVQTHQPFRVEHRFQYPNGNLAWAYVQAIPQWDNAGHLMGYLGTFTDISDLKQAEIALQTLNQNLEDMVELRTEELSQTNARLRQEIAEREQAEAALRESRWFLELVLDNVPQAVFWKDKNYVYGGCNRHFARNAGLASKAEIVGMTDFDLPWQASDTQLYRRQDEAVITTNTPELHILETHHQADGQTRWLETNKMPLCDSTGQVIGILGSYEDITDRILAEEALKESQRFAQTITETSPCLLYIYDMDKRHTVYANREYLSTLGYSIEDLQRIETDMLTSLTHVEDLPRVNEHLQRLTEAQNDEILEVEYRMQSASGQWHWLRSRDTVFSRDSEGRVRQTIGAALDISDRKCAEAEILRALEQEKELNVLKSRFISMASHELRTPLTTILGSTELLHHFGHKWPEEKKDHYFEQIKHTVHHMTALVQDVLLYSKAESEHLCSNPTSFDLTSFCDDLIEELTSGVLEPGRVNFEGPGLGYRARLDQRLLRQILVNLLGNALKYSAPSSLVFLRVTCQPDQVTFEIEDQGIGIPQQDLPHLYESFHRGSNVGSLPGTGLGLAVVKRAVDLCQGQVDVASEESRGTLVTVVLPDKPF